jgi:hypothetical protein
VKEATEEKLAAAGVKHNFISSGKDDYRYVDIVPERAGKLAALEYGLSHKPLPVGQCSLISAPIIEVTFFPLHCTQNKDHPGLSGAPVILSGR